ncbi:T9SS type A sorting domain-containing protein [Hymenobacter sp. J193]|uniref:T9SS type A sorting domain-containing protein n=1 Tax=Hymenobacter sp. J193 TaxID=2898429 RepID=UPI002150C6D1|nr:T9SS type A sorting domain-containing protein [Hymenobacter sp. J193]MCR5889051.1 T9SS type A sorting domain-containing protein [Hymenobacter sp. J193]
MGADAGEFAQPVTGLAARTTYSVRAYAINSAGASYGSVQTFTTGVATATQPAQLPGVHVYPNPARQQITITRSAGALAAAALYNSMGQLVWQGMLSDPVTRLPVQHWARGMYVLRLTAPQGVATQRLVLE